MLSPSGIWHGPTGSHEFLARAPYALSQADTSNPQQAYAVSVPSAEAALHIALAACVIHTASQRP